jgi:hypothetical protein
MVSVLPHVSDSLKSSVPATNRTADVKREVKDLNNNNDTDLPDYQLNTNHLDLVPLTNTNLEMISVSQWYQIEMISVSQWYQIEMISVSQWYQIEMISVRLVRSSCYPKYILITAFVQLRACSWCRKYRWSPHYECKSESSLKTYTGYTSNKTKKTMSSIVSDSLKSSVPATNRTADVKREVEDLNNNNDTDLPDYQLNQNRLDY